MNNEKSFRLFIISITSLASFLIAFMSSAINIALPVIGKEFNSGAVLLSWLATAYILTGAVLLIPLGKLSDIYGRSKFLKIGIFVFMIGTLLCGLSGKRQRQNTRYQCNSCLCRIIVRSFHWRDNNS